MRCTECEEIELARVRDERPVQVLPVPNDALAGFQTYRPLIFGAIMIACMLFAPGGLAAMTRRQS